MSNLGRVNILSFIIPDNLIGFFFKLHFFNFHIQVLGVSHF